MTGSADEPSVKRRELKVRRTSMKGSDEPPNSMSAPPQSEDHDEASWFRALRRSWLGLTIASIAVIFVGFANLTDAIDKALVFFHLKPDALDLARDDERSRFARELMRLAWQRLATMNKYRVMVEREYPQSEQDTAWQQYAAVFDEWNRDLMANIIGLEQEYNQGKSSQFENRIQPAFTQLHDCIQGMRRPSDKIPCFLSLSHDNK